MDMRDLKRVEVAARIRIAFEHGPWSVPSQLGSGKYRVTLKPGENSWTCEDFILHQQPCKHIHAARLVQERDHGGRAPSLDREVMPKPPTYGQNWPAYNKAYMMEK